MEDLLDTAYRLKARNRPRRVPPSPAEVRYARLRPSIATIGPDADVTIERPLGSSNWSPPKA